MLAVMSYTGKVKSRIIVIIIILIYYSKYGYVYKSVPKLMLKWCDQLVFTNNIGQQLGTGHCLSETVCRLSSLSMQCERAGCTPKAPLMISYFL